MGKGVSLVVPIRNAGTSLPRTIRAIRALVPPPDEVVLVDNGSSDESPRLIQEFAETSRHLRIHSLYQARRGASVARNTGIREAQGDIIAFTDADCAPAPDWLCHLRQPFADPIVGAVAGRVVPAPPTSTLQLFSALYTLRLPAHAVRQQRWTPWEGGYPTANIAVRRKLLVELQGFDESVDIYGEDYDLCARLYQRGFEIAYVPEARVSHHHRTTLAGMLRQAFGFGRSHPYLLRRHTASGLWLEIPRASYVWPGCPLRAWIDLTGADKKLLGIALLGMAYEPAWGLLPLYVAWLSLAAARRAREVGRVPSLLAALELAALLALKSASMTAGRWWGSVRYGAACL